MSKVLKVTSIGPSGEHTIAHPVHESMHEHDFIVATLQGVNNAGHSITAFEIVEA